ncbi:MAG: DUF1016 domain-containing protein [Chloroflexales bacterium]|nr:DUF1016 domain-containing protein [Chloroflexales bacterium]
MNQQLIGLSWDIGRLIGELQQGETWGRSVVEQLARDLQGEFLGLGGFSARNLWRMRRFYDTYASGEKLAPLMREIDWTHNLIILDENPSIGIILCKSKDKTIVAYALRESARPIGVATYRILSTLPSDLQGQLPVPEQVARLLEDVYARGL